MSTLATTATTAPNAKAPAAKAPTYEELKQQLAKMQEELRTVKAAPRNRLTAKVSPKGAVQVNGLGRWPLTLYASQWPVIAEQLMGVDPSAFADTPIGKFIAEHREQLTWKD